MKDFETIKDYSDRLLSIANKVRLLGSGFTDSRIVEKILVTVPERYEATITTLENTKDLSKISSAELLNALQAPEQRRLMRKDKTIEGALAAKHQNDFEGNGASTAKGKNGNQKKSYPPCQHCGKKGHPPFRYQEDEDQLFVASCFASSSSTESWLIDSSCTNHMTNDKELFRDLRPTDITKVIIGNGDFISVKGKGTITISSSAGPKKISDVLYVPEIDQNLLSVGQLIKKGFKVIFEDSFCYIFDITGQEILRVRMKGKSFSFDPIKEEPVAFPTETSNTEIWHKRLGHCHLQSMQLLKRKELTARLPAFGDHLPNCNACQYGT
ncbi:hypothetical protein F0562_013571 [Nyssa sinensis]|uniref:Uncharacterized protein n=1 Tax=Nyssa sinensis TaxID=561372 RepID=A0A5J4ZL55_9ASTE|nr:hypothetical protein F0562_013571 [Nyssa sinensis]